MQISSTSSGVKTLLLTLLLGLPTPRKSLKVLDIFPNFSMLVLVLENPGYRELKVLKVIGFNVKYIGQLVSVT